MNHRQCGLHRPNTNWTANMHFKRCLGIALVMLISSNEGDRKTRTVKTNQQNEPAQSISLNALEYPGAKVYKDYKNMPADIATHIAKYTSEDAPDRIIKWYKTKLVTRMQHGQSIGKELSVDDGFFQYSSERITEEGVVHDYERSELARPLSVWVATIKRDDTDLWYVLTVAVTRGKTEDDTHIALSWLSGSKR